MFTFPLPLLGPLNAPIESFTSDPLLVLKKFPLVKTITQVVPGEYLIETHPVAITNRLAAPKFIVVSVEVVDEQLVFNPPADQSIYPRFDGWVEGHIETINELHSKMELAIQLQTAVHLGVPDALMLNAIQVLSADLANRFRANMRDEAFANTLPV